MKRRALHWTGLGFAMVILSGACATLPEAGEAPVPIATTSTPAPTVLGATVTTTTSVAVVDPEEIGCGSNLPLEPWQLPEGFFPGRRVGPAPGAPDAAEGQTVVHWESEAGQFVELRWPVTDVEADDYVRRVVAEPLEPPCDLAAVYGYPLGAVEVPDIIADFADRLMSPEEADARRAQEQEMQQSRAEEFFCTPPEVFPTAEQRTVKLYLLCLEGLGTGPRPLGGVQPVERVVADDNRPLRNVLEALFAGVNDAEQNAGYVSSAAEAGVELLGLTLDGGVARLDVSIESPPVHMGAALMDAQVYSTVFQFGTVDAVEITLEGSSAAWCGLFEAEAGCSSLTRTEFERRFSG